MGRKFIISNNNFSGGQVTRNLSGGPSEALSNQGLVEAKNVFTESGFSLKKRTGTELSELPVYDDAIKFSLLGTEMIISKDPSLTEGNFYYRKGNEYFKIPITLLPDLRNSIKPNGLSASDVQANFDSRFPAYQSVNLNYPYTPFDIVPDGNGDFYANVGASVNLEDISVSAEGPIVYIKGPDDTAYCILASNKSYESDFPFVIVPFMFLSNYLDTSANEIPKSGEYFKSYTRRKDRLYYPSTITNRRFRVKVYQKDGHIGNLVGIDHRHFKISGGELKQTTILILTGLDGRYILYPNNSAVINDSSDTRSVYITYYAYSLDEASVDNPNPRGRDNNRVQQDFSITYDRASGVALSDNPDDSGEETNITQYNSINNFRVFESEWNPRDTPDGLSIGRSLSFFKRNKIWESSISNVAEFFAYKRIVADPEAPGDPGGPLDGSIAQFRGDETILDIQFSNQYFIITNLGVWSKTGRLISGASPFHNVSYKGGLGNNKAVRVDGGLFYLSNKGELLHIDYNFSRSSFNTTNYSSILSFNNDPKFIDIFVLDRYNNHLFLVAEDGSIYVFYNRFENNISSWTHLDLGINVKNYIPLGDKILFNGGFLDLFNSNNYLDNYQDFGSEDGLPRTLQLKLLPGANHENVILILDGVHHKGLCNASGVIDLSNFSGQSALEIKAGILIDSNIKLFPLNPIDFAGSGYNQWKNVESIEARVFDTKRLKIITDHGGVTTPIKLEGNKGKDFIRFKGIGSTTEDYNISINHKYNEPFKILGLTIQGSIR